MRHTGKLTKVCLALAGMGIASHWAAPAQAGQWVRATTATNEDIAMDYVGQRTLSVGTLGLTSSQTDALWVLGAAKDGSNQNHYTYVWTPSGWSNPAQTAYGATMVLGGGSPNDFPYAISDDQAVYGWTGGSWYQYVPPGSANPLGFIQESSWVGNLFFSQAGIHCDYWYGHYNSPCIDEYNVFGQYWVGQNIAELSEGTGSDDLNAGGWPYLPNGPYRLAVDPGFYNGSSQIKINWDNVASPMMGELSVSSDGGQHWADCQTDPYQDTLPVLVDVAVYRGNYYGIEINHDAQGNLMAPTIATSTSAQVCVGWESLPCTQGRANCMLNSATGTYIDTTPVYALTVDVSNGTLYSVQTQKDWAEGPIHYRVFRWVP